MPERILIGFDPGLASCGYGVIAVHGSRARHIGHGVIRTSSKHAESERLLTILKDSRTLIQKYTPVMAGIESIFFSKNATSAIPVAQARGCILAACAESEVPVVSLSPPAIKQRITGTGSADKAQIQQMIAFLLGMAQIPESDHAADALAAAYAVWQEKSYSEIMRL